MYKVMDEIVVGYCCAVIYLIVYKKFYRLR